MQNDDVCLPPGWVRGTALALGCYALIGGGTSFLGWALDVPRLTDWEGDSISIQPNATLCVLLSGLALTLLAYGRRTPAAACAALVLAIGGLTLFEWISGLALGGFDAVFLFDRDWGRRGVVFPGRMGPPGSLSWTLLGTALLLTTRRSPLRRFAPAMASLAATLGGLSLVGYLYDAEQLFSLPYLSIIAMQAATFIVAVSFGVIFNHPGTEPMRTFLSPGSAGMLARQLVPTVVLLPIVLGALGVRGQVLGLYDAGLGAALLVIALICLLLTVLWRLIRAVREHELREQAGSARLLLQQRELEAVLQAAPAAIWVAHDAACNVVTGNATAASIMRLPLDANMSRSAPGADASCDIYREGRLMTPDDLPMRTAARTGAPSRDVELEVRFRDGTSRWIFGNAVPVIGSGNDLRGAVATFIDVTSLKAAEQRLREADRRKDEFLAVLAHELRNPLAPVRNAVEILRRIGPADADLQWARELIDRQIQQMTRLIDELLDVSRINLGKIDLKRGCIELAEVVRSAVEASRPLIDERGHQLTISLPPQPVYLHADLTRLAQALCNLLNNAARYTDRGGRIELRAEREGSDAVVRVRDTGVGIPRDMLTKVFELFTQVDRSLEKSQGGLGVGLALVKRMVELHGGRVEAYSVGPHRGSEFVVRLPTIDAPAVPAAAPAAVSARANSRLRRVLVVDDNHDAADSLAVLLRLAENEVRTAYDGVEALRGAKEFRPHVVLLDIGMPNMNGYDAARAIRRASGSDPPVLIAITGLGQEADRRRSKDAGFDHHLVKPVDPHKLLNLLASLPTQTAARDAVAER